MPGGGNNQVANPDDAMMMPGGMLLTADIENCRLLLLAPPAHRPHRVIVIDPATHRIVWQYGHTGRAGTAPGYLNDPDGVDLTPPTPC